MDNRNYGVINEQGFVAGQFGFNGLSKEEHDKLLEPFGEKKKDDKDSEKNS